LHQIAEKLGGEAEVVPLDTEDTIGELTAAIRSISPNDPAACSKNEYMALARRGLLLNFVVRAGDQAIAVILGIPSGSTYCVHKIMYAPGLIKYSPGTSAMYLMNKWFIVDGRFKQLDFGYGEPGRKFSSTNVMADRARILLLRKTYLNRLLLGMHRAVVSIENFSRKDFKRIAPPATTFKRWKKHHIRRATPEDVSDRG